MNNILLTITYGDYKLVIYDRGRTQTHAKIVAAVKEFMKMCRSLENTNE